MPLCLLGDTVSYSGVVYDDSGAVVSTFSSTTESATVGSLTCCSQYSYTVVARNRGGEAGLSFRTSAQFDGKIYRLAQHDDPP